MRVKRRSPVSALNTKIKYYSEKVHGLGLPNLACEMRRHKQEMRQKKHVVLYKYDTDLPPKQTKTKAKSLAQILALPPDYVKGLKSPVSPVKSSDEFRLSIDSKAGQLIIPNEIYLKSKKRGGSESKIMDNLQLKITKEYDEWFKQLVDEVCEGKKLIHYEAKVHKIRNSEAQSRLVTYREKSLPPELEKYSKLLRRRSPTNRIKRIYSLLSCPVKNLENKTVLS